MTDLVGPGDGPVRRRPRLLVPLLVALLAAGWGADALVRAHEQRLLLDRVVAAQARADYADRRVAATVEYASPQLSAAAVPSAVRADLQALLAREAAQQRERVRRARGRVAAVGLLPWHGPLRRARAAAVAHLDARAAGLAAVVAGTVPVASSASRETARARLRTAVRPGQRARVDAAYLR